MRDRATEFKVGLLIVAALVILGGFIFVLGNFSLRSGYTVYVDYDFSGNLRPGAPVKVSGIKVGKVKSIKFMGGKVDEKTGRRVYVRVKVWIENRVKDTLREDAEFFVNTAGVLGEQYLEIVPGDPKKKRLEPGSIVRGVDPPRTDLIVARLYEVLDSLSSVLHDDRDMIRNLLKNGASAVSEVNKLLVDNRKQLGTLIANTNSLAGEASKVLGKVNEGLGDPKVIARTIRNTNSLISNTNHAVYTLTPPAKTLLTDATRVTRIFTAKRVDKALTVADRAVAVAGKAGGLIDNVNGMVTDLRHGKGTAGALLVREEIYADLREMIRDLKRNPWKFFWKE